MFADFGIKRVLYPTLHEIKENQINYAEMGQIHPGMVSRVMGPNNRDARYDRYAGIPFGSWHAPEVRLLWLVYAPFYRKRL